MPVDLAKHALQPLVSPVETHPPVEAEAEHHILCECLGLHQLISIQHKVACPGKFSAELKKKKGTKTGDVVQLPLPPKWPSPTPVFIPTLFSCVRSAPVTYVYFLFYE